MLENTSKIGLQFNSFSELLDFSGRLFKATGYGNLEPLSNTYVVIPQEYLNEVPDLVKLFNPKIVENVGNAVTVTGNNADLTPEDEINKLMNNSKEIRQQYDEFLTRRFG